MKRLLFAAAMVAAATAALAGDDRDHQGTGVKPVPAHTSQV